MTERDERVSGIYQGIGTPEPPAALDQAILAASRRALTPRSASQRWAVPVSLAAVLVLAVGVTLNKQHEKPGIETAAPANEYSVPAPAQDAAPPTPAPVPPAAKAAAAPPPPAPEAAPSPPSSALRDRAAATAPTEGLQRRQDAVSPLAKRVEKKDFAVTVEQPVVEQPVAEPQAKLRAQAAPEPRPFTDPAPQVAQSNIAPPPMAATQAPAAPAARVAPTVPAPAPLRQRAEMQSSDQFREKREVAGASADAARETDADPRERELERIARLRREGRHAEADEALEKFRRDHPAYRIPAARWEQVKPR